MKRAYKNHCVQVNDYNASSTWQLKSNYKQVNKIISLAFFAMFLVAVSNINLSAQSSDRPTQIEAGFLESLLNRADEYIMLKVKNGKIYALDAKRNAIYPSGYRAPAYEIFYVYKTGDLKEAIKEKRTKNLKLRKDLTDDNVIMLNSDNTLCPPTCP